MPDISPERLRAQLRDARNDLLDIRSALWPNGEPGNVPASVSSETAAPAVRWLIAEVERLHGLLTAAVAAAHTDALIESSRRIYAARLAAEGPRAEDCEGGMWCRCQVISPCYPPRNA